MQMIFRSAALFWLLLIASAPAAAQTAIPCTLTGEKEFRLFGEELRLLFAGEMYLHLSDRPRLTGNVHLAGDTLIYIPRQEWPYRDTLRLYNRTDSCTLVFMVSPRVLSNYSVFNQPVSMGRDIEEYTQIDSVSTITETRNGETRALTDMIISGVVVRFAPGQAVYDVLNNSVSLRKVTVYAREIIFEDTLKLYQADIALHAPIITFIDSDLKTATVLTSPANHPPTAGKEGIEGYSAGSISVWAQKINVYPRSNGGLLRFFANGSQGSNALDGANGNDAETVPWQNTASTIYVAVCPAHSPASPCFARKTEGKWSDKELKSIIKEIQTKFRGKSATPGGVPGMGGKGGIVRSNLNLAAISQVDGGRTGKSAPAYTGGAPAAPSVGLCYYYSESIHDNTLHKDHGPSSAFDIIRVYECPESVPLQPGEGATTISAAKINVGSIILEPSADVLWHPLLFTRELTYIKDLYLHNHLQEAHARLTDAISTLTALEGTANYSSASRQYGLLLEEMRLYRQQLEHNLDFYGNPPGWVPMVPYTYIEQQYREEVEHAGALLATLHTLKLVIAQAEARNRAYDQLRIDAVNSIRDNIAGITAIRNSLVHLDLRVKRKDQLLAFVNSELIKREKELELIVIRTIEDQQKKQKRKNRLNQLCSIAQMVPVGQPYTGLIAKGIQMYNQDGFGSVEGIIGSAVELGESYGALEDYQHNVDTLLMGLKGVDYSSFKSIKVAMKNKDLQKRFSSVKAHFKQQNFASEKAAPVGQLQTMLAQLKQSDPEYLDLTRQIDTLIEEKAALAVIIDAATSQMEKYLNDIEVFQIGLDTIAKTFLVASNNRDPVLIMYFQMMEDRAWERVNKYFYYLYKTYEYAYVEPYNGELDFFRIRRTIKGSENGQQIATLFKERLRDLVSVITNKNANVFQSPDRIESDAYHLSPTELEQFNRTDTVVLNFCQSRFFNTQQENIRLIDIKAPDIQNHYKLSGAPAEPVRNGNIVLQLLHKGESFIRKNGRVYLFRHYSWQTENKIYWRTKYDLVTHQLASQSVNLNDFYKLFFESTYTLNEKFMFPAACADLMLIKDAQVGPYRQKVTFDDLLLELTYYSERNYTKQELVLSSGPAPVYFVAGEIDQPEQCNGYESMVCYFPNRAQVRVRAAPVEPGLRFSHWEKTDSYGRTTIITSEGPSVLINLDESMNWKAVFEAP
ncbi:MAG: hypothetical protein ACKVT2_07945 [Saprospiraceae bacterium]